MGRPDGKERDRINRHYLHRGGKNCPEAQARTERQHDSHRVRGPEGSYGTYRPVENPESTIGPLSVSRVGFVFVIHMKFPRVEGDDRTDPQKENSGYEEQPIVYWSVADVTGTTA